MSVHEFAHGWVAYLRGDKTAKSTGRLTLNPLAHIDPFWTLLLPFFLYMNSGGSFLFGAARPVPINYWSLKNPKRDIIWIGMAGPLANFIFALTLSGILRFLPLPVPFLIAAESLIVVNVVLGVFNLIPIPPLDGSRILMGLLPNELSRSYARVEPFGIIILIVLIWSGFFGSMVFPVVELILRLLHISF